MDGVHDSPDALKDVPKPMNQMFSDVKSAQLGISFWGWARHADERSTKTPALPHWSPRPCKFHRDGGIERREIRIRS